MNHAEELCHSSGPWKKHKYFQKIGEGANAVYKYAKSADKTITGSAYKKEAKDEKERSEYANELAGHAPNALRVARNVDDVKNGVADFTFKTPDQWADSAAYHGRKAAEAEANYYSKSLFGKTEKAANSTKHTVRSIANDSVSRGQSIINKLLGKDTEKRTIKDTMTGKTRTPAKPKSASDTINIKEQSEKNKKSK